VNTCTHVILTSQPPPLIIPIAITLGPRVPDNNMCIQLAGKTINNNYHHKKITSSDLRSWHSGPKWQALSTTSCNNVISTNNRYKAPCPNNLIANYMNNLIQSLPSPSPTAGITHTWMGESWMVDGEASVMMMKFSSKSLSRQGARTEFLVPNRGF
jgi:hypothetical protein